jgi:hypothetical protein
LTSSAASPYDTLLREGDRIISKQKLEVTEMGDAQSATSHFYPQDFSRDGRIWLSRGATLMERLGDTISSSLVTECRHSLCGGR